SFRRQKRHLRGFPRSDARSHPEGGGFFVAISGEVRLLISCCLSFLANVAEHIRMNVQTDVGYVVEMLACNEPNDLANLALRIITGHARKSLRINFLFLG